MVKEALWPYTSYNDQHFEVSATMLLLTRFRIQLFFDMVGPFCTWLIISQQICIDKNFQELLVHTGKRSHDGAYTFD